MPQLSRDQNKLNLGAARSAQKAKASAEEEEIKASAKKPSGGTKKTVKKSTQEKQPRTSRLDLDVADDDDEDDYDEDEIIQSSIKSKKEGSNNNTKFIIIGGIVVAVIVILFLIFRPKAPAPPTIDPNQQVQSGQQGQTGEGDISGATEPLPPEVPDDENFGTQNFLQDTNNTADTPLTDPEDFTKDIYGLTLRVDYTVSKIQYASDFVNYTKHRGTWGGGLELYYLDCEYKGSRYVIQVPFKYYKELDDEGIVPVKMEVLRIQSETDGTFLSVVSYMCLDEKTLESVLKTQSK